MLFISQDVRVTRDTWDLARALGATKAVFYSNAGDILQQIAAGAQFIGYDVMGSYALEWQKKHHEIGVVFPSDYVLLTSRIAFIPQAAQHPNAARLFLDFLLSPAGQSLLSHHSMMPLRLDVPLPADEPRLDPFHTQTIEISPGLLANLDRLVRIRFKRDWARALGGS
jgi:iron(III) transport system substrate-binding protein